MNAYDLIRWDLNEYCERVAPIIHSDVEELRQYFLDDYDATLLKVRKILFMAEWGNWQTRQT